MESTASCASATPVHLKQQLDRRVVAQDSAKVPLSVLMSMHLQWFARADPMRRAPNGLVVGPTGVGKTLTIRTACERLGLPFTIVDATALVPTGLVGMQVEDVLEDLTDAALVVLRHSGEQGPDGHRHVREDSRLLPSDADIVAAIALAERGVVFLDEFDKLRRVDDSSLNVRAQRRLLKLTDGGVVNIGARDYHAKYAGRTMNTSGILFLAGGTFSAGPDDLSDDPLTLTSDDSVAQSLVRFGFVPELVGRFPAVIRFAALEPADYLQILRHPEFSPLCSWREYLARMGMSLRMSSDFEERLTDRARSLGVGARGLEQAVFSELSLAVYEAVESGSCEVVME